MRNAYLMSRDKDTLPSVTPMLALPEAHELWLTCEAANVADSEPWAAQDMLVHSEKLASIGQFMVGVAHEINNPIGYIVSNFGVLENYLDNLFEMLDGYERAEVKLAGTPAAARLQELRERIELDFLKQDIPKLMSESKEGISRVRKIAQSLMDFSRVDVDQEWVWSNLHHGIDSTLNIVNNELKYKAEVLKQYGMLPEIFCLPSELNQVFMNLLVNAAHAVTAGRGLITIRSGTDEAATSVWIEISDNGSGIPKESLPHIFTPFFTTKPVGKGTGLGLSLSYDIVRKHQGDLNVSSQVGQGTTVRVTLPVHGPVNPKAARLS